MQAMRAGMDEAHVTQGVVAAVNILEELKTASNVVHLAQSVLDKCADLPDQLKSRLRGLIQTAKKK